MKSLLIAAGKRELLLDPLWTNAAGSLGFADESRRWVPLNRLGAFVTSPISFYPRTIAQPPRTLRHQSSLLLHTGLPNPGFKRALNQHRRRWARLACPVIVHLLGEDPVSISTMVEHLEELKNVVAIEVGLGPTERSKAEAIIRAAATGELPVLAHFPMQRWRELAMQSLEAGAAAVTIAAPRSSLPTGEGSLVHGRLYGPAILPLALEVIQQLRSLTSAPILGSGGLYAKEHAGAMFQAGASALQFDTVLWTNPLILEQLPG